MITSKALSYTMEIVMISIQKCKEILNSGKNKYSDDEIKIIREQLTKLSQIEYEFYKQAERDEKSSHLHKGIN